MSETKRKSHASASARGAVARAGRQPPPVGAPSADPLIAEEVRGWPPWAKHGERSHSLVQLGSFAWALLGITGLLVLGWLLAKQLSVVVIPLLLALFPAALLAPV